MTNTEGWIRLIDLEPHWINAELNGPWIGMSFQCPHCKDLGGQTRLAIYFVGNIMGRTAAVHLTDTVFQKTGETFDTMSITPSIDASKYGHWHGFITNGKAQS